MNPILAYFDLNNREATIPLSPILAGPHEQAVTNENLLPDTIQPVPFGERNRRRARRVGHAAPTLALWEQIVLYLGTVIGVLFSSSVLQFQSGKAVILISL